MKNLLREIIHGFFSGAVHGSLWNKMYRNVFEKDPNLDLPSSINMCEDVRLNVQMLLKCRKIVCCPDILYHYRANPDSLSSKRNARSFESEISNMQLYDKILDDRYFTDVLDQCKRCILSECILYNAIPAGQWHSLWRRAKFGMLTAHYSIKLKMIFFLACINYPFASRLWRKMKKQE